MDPSSTNILSSPNSFLENEKNDYVHLNYHQQIDNLTDFVCHLPPVTNDVVLQQQYCYVDQNDVLDSVVSSYKMKLATSKNDGHSKIYTAGSVRDHRRVRLSIDISRKFFCLQDLLGFDKASKTLDWLLTKSLTAIKDLVEQKSQSSSSTITNEYKARFLETINQGDSDDEKGHKKKSLLKSLDGKVKKSTQIRKLGSQENLSREKLRAEARARARQRTKEKNRAKNLDDCELGCCDQTEL
ncbi:hypothetical protein R6Q59_034834 [Mikania micrantha]